jgi:hypothetical protein
MSLTDRQGTDTRGYTERQKGDLINHSLFFQNKENGLKILYITGARSCLTNNGMGIIFPPPNLAY